MAKDKKFKFLKPNLKQIKQLEQEDTIAFEEMDGEDDEKVREVIVEHKSGFSIAEVIVIIVVSIVFGVVVGSTLSLSHKSVDGVAVSDSLQEFIVTYHNIVDNYYKRVKESDLVDAAIEGMISSLDDPYSVYMDESDSKTFSQTVDGSYVGIGARVSTNAEGEHYIVDMFDDSSAKKAGFQAGDVFIKVGNKEVSDMTLDELTSQITGKAGTKVTITVKRDGQEITKTIVRKSIDLSSVTANTYEKNGKKVGYLYISTFAANTYDQFKKELLKLEKSGIDSLVIDVRSNPGGHLTQVSNVLELFMKKNQILYQVEVKGKTEKIKAKTKDARSYPIAILVNSSSASASEILAASFQEAYSKAKIVGKTTYGKGTVQKAYNLSDGSSLKYTTEKWLTPKGNWINEKGVIPDYEVELEEAYFSNPTDDTDSQLQKALEVLTEKET